MNLKGMSEEELKTYLDKQEDTQIRRAEQLAEAYDSYRRAATACSGYMVIRKGPTIKPTATDLRLAYCNMGIIQ